MAFYPPNLFPFPFNLYPADVESVLQKFLMKSSYFKLFLQLDSILVILFLFINFAIWNTFV